MKKLWITTGAVLLVGLTVTLIYLNILSDKIGPEIVFTTTDLVYHEGDTFNDLLSGVSAIDSVDGDVTDSLMIVTVLPLTDKHTAKVQYVAKDKSNNLSITNLMVDYIPSSDSEENNENVGVTAEDNTTLDKNGVTTTEENIEASTEETAEANNLIESADSTQDENSLEITDTETTESVNSLDSIDDSESSEIVSYPYIKLSCLEITIKKGYNFDIYSVIEKLEDDVDGQDILWKRIQVYGKYYTSKTGSYQLSYYATDTDLNQSNVEYLTLHVVE